jgi:endonuclease G
MKIYNLLVALTLSINILSQTKNGLEIPLKSFDTIINHSAYSLSFNHKYQQANWVAYCSSRTSTNLGNKIKRSNNFTADPLIKGTDLSLDYEKSGYDRGHLAPAADMGFSKITMLESFYYSNMSPQLPGFNRGIWKQLEEQTRNWAIEYDSLYIVVGPIFSDSMKVIGPHQVAVPNAYFKVILDNHKGMEKMIAFIMKNEKSKNSLQSFTVSVDSVEEFTGIDFFPLLDDPLEMSLENLLCLKCWKLTSR